MAEDKKEKQDKNKEDIKAKTEEKNEKNKVKEETKEKLEKAKKETKKKAKEVKEKIEEKAEKIEDKAEEIEDKIEDKAEKIEDKIEDKVEEIKTNKSSKKNMTVIGIILVAIIVVVSIISYCMSPRAVINSYLDLRLKNPAKAFEKYMPNKKFRDKKREILNSKVKYNIKKIDKINKDKYSVEVELKNVDIYKVEDAARKKAEKSDKYIKNADDVKDIAKNQNLELDILQEEVKKADLETSKMKFNIYKEAKGNWVVIEEMDER